MKNILVFTFLLFSTFGLHAQLNDPFVYTDGNKTVRIELENNLKYIPLLKTVTFKVYVENIDLRETRIIGSGIRVTGNQGKDFFTCTTLVKENSVVNNCYAIRFDYPSAEDGKMANHTFLIPVEK